MVRHSSEAFCFAKKMTARHLNRAVIRYVINSAYETTALIGLSPSIRMRRALGVFFVSSTSRWLQEKGLTMRQLREIADRHR